MSLTLNRTNKNAGKCFRCGAQVAAERGYLIRREDIADDSLPDRAFFVLCNSKPCVASLVGVTQVEQLDRQAVLADGRIMVHDPKSIEPYLRAIGYLDKSGQWRIYPHRRDRDHVLRIADKLELDVDPSLREYEDPKPVRDAVARAQAIETIRDYQLKDVRWLAYRGLDDSKGYSDTPPYQLRGRDRGALLCLDQGLGKTIETLLQLHDDEALVVGCNKSAKGVWPAEAKKWRPDRFDTFTMIEGEQNFRWPTNPREMIIVNYDILPRTQAQIQDDKEHARAKLHGWQADPDAKIKWRRKDIRGLYALRRRETIKLRRFCRLARPTSTSTGARHELFLRMLELADLNAKIQRIKREAEKLEDCAPVDKPPCPVCLVGDESHYVENSRALRTQRWRELGKHARRIIGLTGTPVESEPMRFRGLLDSARSNPFPSWWSFIEAFNGYKGMWGGWEFERHPPPPGSTAKGRVKVKPGTTEQLGRVMLRREKKDVAKDLPPKVFCEIPVEISEKAKKDLDEFTAQYIGEVLEGDISSIPLAAMSGLLKRLSKACIPTMLDFVESCEQQGEPLVVFAANRAPIEALAKRDDCFAVLGGKVSGPGKPKDAHDAAERFQRAEGSVFAGTSAAAESLTLTRASKLLQVIPFMSRKKNVQAYDRLHRIGQKAEAVTIYLLVPDHVFVHHVFALLAAKDQFVEDVLNGETEPDISHVSRFVDEPEEVWRERALAKVREDAEREKRKLAREAKARERALAVIAGSDVSPKLSEKRAKLRAQRLQAEGVEVVDFDAPKDAVREAMRYMLSICDGAQAKDDAGFNAPDSAVARWLAPGIEAGKRWATASGVVLLRRYPRQLRGQWPELFKS